MRTKLGLASVLTAALAMTGTTTSANTAVLNEGSDWRKDLTIYMMLPLSTTGTSTIDGTSADVDLDLEDVLELLDFGASGRFEAWRGEFGLILDGYYADLSSSGQLPGPAAANVSVDVTQYWLAALAAYRVSSGKMGNTGQRFSFDIQAGVRYNSLRQEVKLSGGPGGGENTLGGTERWWEPVVGLRYVQEINDRWTAGALADFGGFGVNGDDLQMSVTLGADYAFGNKGALKLGLRYYSIDYSTDRSSGEFAYDVEQVGPFIGYTFKF